MIAHPHDVIRVHDGVLRGGRHVGGCLFTVVDVSVDGFVATQSTGDRPEHFGVDEVDLVYWQGRW